MKPKIECDAYLSVVMDVFWQKEIRRKTTPVKTFQIKTSDKTPGQELARTKANPYVKTHVYMHVAYY